jgi:hypothetical protein
MSTPALEEANHKVLHPQRVYWSPSGENGANFGRLTSTGWLLSFVKLPKQPLKMQF